MSLADNPDALAEYVRHLGGKPIEGRTFRFEMELSQTRRIIPEITKLGVRCDKVAERQGRDVNGHACSIATIELRRPPAKTEYEDERSLIAAIIR
jgi:hypothetical protein